MCINIVERIIVTHCFKDTKYITNSIRFRVKYSTNVTILEFCTVATEDDM